jgi:hypothetical protein
VPGQQQQEEEQEGPLGHLQATSGVVVPGSVLEGVKARVVLSLGLLLRHQQQRRIAAMVASGIPSPLQIPDSHFWIDLTWLRHDQGLKQKHQVEDGFSSTSLLSS